MPLRYKSNARFHSRFQDYATANRIGATINPRASLVWQVNPSLTSKLIYDRAFRAPSFIELNSNRGLQLQGNPNLQPETIDRVELSLQKNWLF